MGGKQEIVSNFCTTTVCRLTSFHIASNSSSPASRESIQEMAFRPAVETPAKSHHPSPPHSLDHGMEQIQEESQVQT
jgi:hypothetical protein